MCKQALEGLLGQALLARIGQRWGIDPVGAVRCTQQLREVDAVFRLRRLKSGEGLATDLRHRNVLSRVAGASIVDGDGARVG
jgi:hypothetical protein